MFTAARLAFHDIWTPAFRSVFWKSLGLTVLMLIALWSGLQGMLALFLTLSIPWLETLITIMAGLGAFIALAFLIVPITSIVAGLFLDDIAEIVETDQYPIDPAGKPLPMGESMVQALRFALVVAAVNIGVFLLILLPGINIAAFFIANGYLLGREYFELAAGRHMRRAEVIELRQAKSGKVFLAGLVIAGFLSIPLLNLLTPLFATAFMVHVFKAMPRGEI